MKRFGTSSFASNDTQMLADAAAASNEDPTALFTDFQWFLYEGRDTAFYTAFSTRRFDARTLQDAVEGMARLAPQLTLGYRGATPGQKLPAEIVAAISTIEDVDSLDGYPDVWLSKSLDIFEQPNLPLFRVMVANRKGGPDADGRASIIQVRASHAVLEGSDSALLTRSQSASHGVMSNPDSKVGWVRRLAGGLRGGALTLTFIILGNLLAASEKPWGFKTLAFKRARIRRLANALGVGQRAFLFALVTHALNGSGPKRHMNAKKIVAAYTMLNGERNDADDAFFRVRTALAKFPVKDDFLDYVKAVDEALGELERKDTTKFQMVINSMFRTLRAMNRVTDRLPGRRFWRFSGGGHIVLTMVPPHRTYGDLTEGMIEPIYCGAWHSAANICTFCPGREYLTLNFSMEQRHIAHVEEIEALLERLERDLLPVGQVDQKASVASSAQEDLSF